MPTLAWHGWHGTAFDILAVCWVKEVVFYKHSTVVMEWMVWCVPSGPIKLIHTYIYHWKLMLTFILGLNLDFKRSFQLAETSGSFFTFKYEIRWPLPLSFLSESLNPTVFNVHRKGWRDERKHITKNRKRSSLTIRGCPHITSAAGGGGGGKPNADDGWRGGEGG